jgi:hypothetical protein
LLSELLLISHLLLPLLLLQLPESLPVPLVPKPLQPVLLDLLQCLKPPLLVALYHSDRHWTLSQLIVTYENVHIVLSFEVGDKVDLEFRVIVGVYVHQSHFKFASIVKCTSRLQKPCVKCQ